MVCNSRVSRVIIRSRRDVKVMMIKKILTGIFLTLLAMTAGAEDIAKLLFDRSAPMVYQVRVIDRASGNKSTIGSGFQVTGSGVIATNYHVVSDFVLEPEMYSIEVLAQDEKILDAGLINFDIVHDLALLKINNPDQRAFRLSNKELHHGNRLYSMGNPHDLGMTIIEGTYNGLVEGSRFRKYLFSGSLNPGMSGGPAFNGDGEVIGINVSKGGEQLSFLVPVKHLKELMAAGFEPLSPDRYMSHAFDSLARDQDDYYGMLLAMDWKTREFQQFELPDKLHDSFKCWGHTLEKKENRFDETHRHCKTDDQIYIKSDLYTGAISFDYDYLFSDELNIYQFYSLLEESYVTSSFTNGDDKEDTTNFECLSDFIVLGDAEEKENGHWKVTTCVREYLDYRGIYDTALIAMHADKANGGNRALKISLLVTGIDRKNTAKLHDKFLRAVRWKR